MESPFVNRKAELDDRIQDLEIQKEELKFSVMNLHEQLLSLRLEEQTNRLATEVSDLEQKKSHLETEIENFHSQTENTNESYELNQFASNSESETLPEFTQEDLSQSEDGHASNSESETLPEFTQEDLSQPEDEPIPESTFKSVSLDDIPLDESNSSHDNEHAHIHPNVLSKLKSFINNSGISYDERSGKWYSPTN